MTKNYKDALNVSMDIILNQVSAELMTLHALTMNYLGLLKNVLNVRLGMSLPQMDYSVLDKFLAVFMMAKVDAHLVDLHLFSMEKVVLFMGALNTVKQAAMNANTQVSAKLTNA